MNLSDTFTPLVERFRRHVSQEMVSNERLVLLFAGAASWAPHAVSALSAHQWLCGQRWQAPSKHETCASGQ